jgi:hypothetical protein
LPTIVLRWIGGNVKGEGDGEGWADGLFIQYQEIVIVDVAMDCASTDVLQTVLDRHFRLAFHQA